MLTAIYDGMDVRNDIQEDAFREALRLFNEAAVDGLAQAPAFDLSQEFLEQLRTGNETFSAFRTHRMQNDMAARLLDADGNLKPFEQWRRDVEDIADHYCRRWLQTEYDTAVIRAQRAAEWKQFEAEADVLPNVRWMPTTSVEQDVYHRQYWQARLTLPIGHPFWQQHRPGDRWNCKCSLEQTDEPTTLEAVADFAPIPPVPGLDNNPADDGRLFARSHPYYTQAYPGAEEAAAKVAGRNRIQEFNKVNSVEEAKEIALKYGIKNFDVGDATIHQINCVLEAIHKNAKYIKLDLSEFRLAHNIKSENTKHRIGGYYRDSNRSIAISLDNFNENIYKEIIPFEARIKNLNKSLDSLKKQLQQTQDRLKIKKNKILKDDEKFLKSKINDVEYKIEKIQRSIEKGEKPLPFTISSTFKKIEQQVQAEIHHEIGHYVYHRLGDPSFKNFIYASEYGRTDSVENFCEFYAKYRMNGPDDIPDNILELFKKMEVRK